MPADRWFAMTRLDENRAKSQLARRANVPVELVTNLAIWGNHSATQFPDFANARVDGVPVPEVIDDTAWLQGEFIETVQKRGAEGDRGALARRRPRRRRTRRSTR